MARCNSCSAPLPAHGPVCEYCGTRNRVDLKGVHEYTVSNPESDRPCPRCSVKLQTINIHGTDRFLIEQCAECFGLFFDPGELEALLEDTVENVFQIDYRKLTAMTQVAAASAVRYGKCPVCGTLMNRVNFGSRSGVVVDRCKGHGVWLDGGELRRLLEWKKAGGQLLHQKLKAENSEQERERRRRQAELARSMLGPAGGSGSSWGVGDLRLADDLPDLLFGLVSKLFR